MRSHLLPRLSPATLRVLRGHRPGVPAYLSWAFGTVNVPAGLAPVDAAYSELVARGLVVAGEPSLVVFPGEVRAPYLLTPEGERVRRMWPATRL